MQPTTVPGELSQAGGLLDLARSAVRNPRILAVAIPGIITALFGVFVLSFPFGLTGIHGSAHHNYGYDDGVYFGAAVRLLHGQLPYADFLFLHPPGIVWLMAPVAGLSTVFGTPVGFAAARLITVAVAAMNASLAALMLRHRGPAAMLTAGLLLALFPAAINATHTLLLEPYVVCFCLIGINLLFDGVDIASTRRILLAGLALGFGCSIKLWGAPVLATALLVLAVRSRRALAVMTAGAAGAFAIACLPFFLAAPGAFISDVFLVQIQRREGGSAGILYKLRMLTGADAIETVHVPDFLVVLVAGTFVAYALYRIVRSHRELGTRDWCILAGAGATTAAVFSTGQFYAHYSYLPLTWIAMAAGVLVAHTTIRPIPHRTMLIVVTTACVLALAEDTRHARVYLEGSFDVADVVHDGVPAGACLTTTFTTFSVVSDRLISDDPDCPPMIDPFGEWVAHTPRHRPYRGTYPLPFVTDFAGTLDRSAYVAFAQPHSNYIPWTPELTRWFAAVFTKVQHADTVVVYQHRGQTPPPTQYPSLMVESANQLVALGIDTEKAGDLPTAFDYYQAAIARDEKNKFAHFDAGHIWQKWGRADRAESEYQEALRLDPDFASALYNLAVLKADTDPAAAIELYRRVAAVQPDNAVAEFNLGVLLCKGGDESGKDLLRAAISAQPNLAQLVPAEITLD